MEKDILMDLNNMQKEAVIHVNGPLLILAGAGSGKTKVITHRIANLIKSGIPAYNIMAITFTNKAAQEMKERVAKILDNENNTVFISTFHSACVRFLRRDIDRLGYDRNFTIYDTSDTKAVIKACIKNLDLDPKIYKEKAVMNVISTRKNKLKSSIDTLDFICTTEYERNMEKLYYAYQKRLKQNNALDFDDLILKTVELLSTNEDIRNYYNEKFKYIMVDEYQDTNNSQFELIRLLSFGHNNLCVVGDDDQSIYKFRGANIENILNFEKYFNDTKIIKLEQNYRSTSKIIDCANAIISNNSARKNKKLWTSQNLGPLPEFFEFDTGFDEAEYVIKDIRDLTMNQNLKYSDFAILYRTNSQSRLFEEKAVMYGIPYKLIGGVNFYGRAEIKDILAYLRLLINTEDTISVQRIINVPKRKIGATTIAKLISYSEFNNISLYEAMIKVDDIDNISAKTKLSISNFCNMIENLKTLVEDTDVKELIEEVYEKTGYKQELLDENTDEAVSRAENISELISKAAIYDLNNENHNLSDFLQEISLVSDVDNLNDEDYVVMMTLHASKGLEFDRVYLTGMEQGIFPGIRAITNDDDMQIEEERRLCYVGITRAKKVLKLTCANKRMLNGQIAYNKASCFIDEIPENMIIKKGPILHDDKNSFSLESSLGHDDYEHFNNMKYDFSTSYQNHSKNNAKFKETSAVSKFIQDIKSKNKNLIKKWPDYDVGDRVCHIKYGFGTVTEITDAGRDYQVSVTFENGQKRILLAGFAKLVKEN